MKNHSKALVFIKLTSPVLIGATLIYLLSGSVGFFEFAVIFMGVHALVCAIFAILIKYWNKSARHIFLWAALAYFVSMNFSFALAILIYPNPQQLMSLGSLLSLDFWGTFYFWFLVVLIIPFWIISSVSMLERES